MNTLLDFYNKNYSLLFSDFSISKRKKLFIGTKDNRKCRFCGKIKPDTTFRKEAHALPAFIGNKRIISLEECDSCNEEFGKTLEDHFAKFSLPSRVISQVRGRVGVPSYKHKIDKRSRIDFKDMLSIIGVEGGNPFVEHRPDHNQIVLNFIREPYVPVQVFKCLVKMGLSLLPSNEVGYFEKLIKWVRSNHGSEGYPFSKLPCFITFTPGPMPYKGVINFLFKRKDENGCVPYLTYIIAFGNEMYQIFIPSFEKDRHLQGKNVILKNFPSSYMYDSEYPYGKSKCTLCDLTSNEIK